MRFIIGIVLLAVGILFFVWFADAYAHVYDNYQKFLQCHPEIINHTQTECSIPQPPVVVYVGELLAGSSLSVIGSVIIVKDRLKRHNNDSKR